MKKSKKAPITLSKNIQLTFITTAAISLVMNAAYYIGLLVRVYPQGMRLSQFSVMAISSILLPALLFLVAYVVDKKSTTSVDRIFKATLLATVGMAIHTVVVLLERLLTQYLNIYNGMPAVTWISLVSVVVAVGLYAGLVFTLYSTRYQNSKRALQFAATAIIALAFISAALFSISSLVLQHVGTTNPMNLFTHPLLITPVILPIAFFLTAYLTTARTNGRLDRLFTSTIFTLTGALIIWITTTLLSLGIWTISMDNIASIYMLDLPTAIVTLLSLIIYIFLIVTHTRPTKRAK